jgi:hypothetical protein
MRQHEASRTLVKSPPELWAECSDAAALARHLGGFGEIRITRLDPETAVAWEGEQVRGTVRIEPAGWGTKVILTAEEAAEDAATTEPPAPTETPAPNETPVSVETPMSVETPVSGEPPVPADPLLAVEAVVAPSERSEPLSGSTPARRRRFPRLRAFLRGPQPDEPVLDTAEPPSEAAPAQPEPMSSAEPEPVSTAEPVAEPSATVVPGADAALAAALDSLGQAHHRPYSRA